MSNNSVPLISVIIPCYNTERYVGLAIQSVLDQTFRDFEIIVVDDGSTDNSASIIKSFKDERVRYVYQKNGGLSNARNTGIKKAKGRFIALLDADDVFLRNNLQVCYDYIKGKDDIGLVTGSFQRIDSNGKVLTSFRKMKTTVINPEEQIVNNKLIPTGNLIRKDVIEKIGGFNEKLRASEEWEFHTRLCFSGKKCVIIPPLTYQYRETAGSITSNVENLTKKRFEALEEIFSLPEALKFQHLKSEAKSWILLKAGINYFFHGNKELAAKNIKSALLESSTLSKNSYFSLFNFSHSFERVSSTKQETTCSEFILNNEKLFPFFSEKDRNHIRNHLRFFELMEAWQEKNILTFLKLSPHLFPIVFSKIFNKKRFAS